MLYHYSGGTTPSQGIAQPGSYLVLRDRNVHSLVLRIWPWNAKGLMKQDTEVLGGNPILAESAQKSVMQWKFSPGSSETALEISVVFDPYAESRS
jgi:hypothetical protein